MPLRLLRLPDVVERTGLPKSTIYLWMGRGTFPHNITLGFRSVAWMENEIEDWIAERVRMSRHAAPRTAP